MKKIFLLIILPALFAQFLFLPAIIPAASADGPADIKKQQGFGTGSEIENAFGGAPKDPRLVVTGIIKVALGLLGTIFIALLIYAGFKYMTSGGSEEKMESAKGTILQAIIGLVIILSAYGITVFVTKSIMAAMKKSIY
jgi:hypothetical protein